MAKKRSQQEIQEAKEMLTRLTEKTKVLTLFITSVSKSGLTRKGTLYIADKDGRLLRLNHTIHTLFGDSLDKEGKLAFGGCGFSPASYIESDINRLFGIDREKNRENYIRVEEVYT